MIHLHVHSMYSLRDSIIRPEELADRIKELDMDAVALTDHGNLYGAINVYQALKAKGIKYIHGCEMYICDDTSIKEKGSKYAHLIILCKNETGRLNLNKLVSKSEHPSRKYVKPRIDFNLLREHKDGLIILSACMAGELSRLLSTNNYDGAYDLAKKYKDEFGEDYYIEIQSHDVAEQIQLNKKLISIANSLGIKYVVTTDAHYAKEEDHEYQSMHSFYGKDGEETYKDCYLQSEEEVRSKLYYLPKEYVNLAIQNTREVADKCNLEIPLSDPIIPPITTPPEFSSNKEWLQYLCEEGFRKKVKLHTLPPIKQMEYRKRYEYEIDSLERMGFIDYILLVYSYANITNKRGPSRGSGGGSLVCYLANITNIDPVEHGLYFERFIDVGALSLLESGEITKKELKIPDIDLDFASDACEDVLRFLYDKYGEPNVASIGKFTNSYTKAMVRDIGKTLDIPLKTTDAIAKSFGEFEIEDIDQMISGEVPVIDSAKEAIKYVKEFPELFKYVRRLSGLPKSFGLHACGRVISTRPLDEFLPSSYDANGIRFLQGDMHNVEDMGLVKIDVLGLRTINQLFDTLEQSGEPYDYIDPKKQDFSDEKVIDIFRNGKTTGIFQFSSNGMKNTLKKLDVRNLDDLSVANAMFRPGAMAYIDNFCRRRKGLEEFEYLHPDLKHILENTYGIIVFQEQLIEIGRYAGIHNPDLLRKATGKKNPALLAQVKPELHDKLIEKGWTEEQFDKLWEDMLAFARYSFNKAHSQSYALIAFLTAKQKAYYPAEFFAGLCNSYIGHSDYVRDTAYEIIDDMQKHGVRIFPFNFRHDHRKCLADHSGKVLGIHYAIPLIRDCNELVAEILYRFSDSKYEDFWQLATQLIGAGMQRSQLEILIKLGFFSEEYGNTRKLLKIMDVLDVLKFGRAKLLSDENLATIDVCGADVDKYLIRVGANGNTLKRSKIANIEGLLHELESAVRDADVEELSVRQRADFQRQYLGFVSFATNDPKDRWTVYVHAVNPVYRRSDKKQFGYSVCVQSIGTGKQSKMTVMNNVYNKAPVKAGDVISIVNPGGWSNERGYFNLNKYCIVREH